MKAGELLGGIVIGALVGVGVGYVLGTDAEKRKQWIEFLGDKMTYLKDKVACECKEKCDCEETPPSA